MKKPDDYLNNHCDSDPTSSCNELMGGNIEKWKLEIEKKQNFVNIPSVGELMGEIYYALKNIKRTDFPIFLDPNTASFIQVAQHAKIRQYLSDSTIIKNMRYARFMELHACSVDFRDLKPESVLKHFDYRLEFENATAHALAHEKKAIMMFLRSYGMKKEELELWAQVLKTPPVSINEKVNFVYPQDVHKFFTYEGYSKNRNYNLRVYENKLFQHIAFLGFNFGMRCPSEIVNITLDMVKINKDGTGHITIIEKKKHGRERDLIPYDKKILSSKAYKTPKNYLDNWRPKVATDSSGDAFFLMPDGNPITEKYVRDHLSPNGKKITKNARFKPYHMRHTFATYYYQLTKNLKKVSVKLGHTKTKNTDKYVAIAEDLEEQFKGKNLFNIALKPHNINVGGKQNNNRLLWVRGVKGAQLKVISPVGVDGLSRAKHFLQKGLLWVESHFHHQLKVQFFFNNHLITTKWPLKPFFSFFIDLFLLITGRCNYACAMV
jgi:site-specific recombinase XerD